MKWKKEILVSSLKDLIKHDLNECLQPIKASNFSVPDGDCVFPMKDRYEKVRSGGASDALELLRVNLLRTKMPRSNRNRKVLMNLFGKEARLYLTQARESLFPFHLMVSTMMRGAHWVGGIRGVEVLESPMIFPLTFGSTCPRNKRTKLLKLKQHQTSRCCI